ncbi:MAG: hypothetical protein BWY09_03064 [Candidatus Hydrogenedentes bacterium ADurb.Bin179]|nr:MAG: hypothetical protein BWY09_03064 [Candidatus Hydrogenedentes bacterium ADurb.Bin179]
MDQPGIGPVRHIAGNAVAAVQRRQAQFPRAGQVHFHDLGRGRVVHHARVKPFLPVHPHLENDAPFAATLPLHAHFGSKGKIPALQRHDHLARRMVAKAPVILRLRDTQVQRRCRRRPRGGSDAEVAPALFYNEGIRKFIQVTGHPRFAGTRRQGGKKHWKKNHHAWNCFIHTATFTKQGTQGQPGNLIISPDNLTIIPVKNSGYAGSQMGIWEPA